MGEGSLKNFSKSVYGRPSRQISQISVFPETGCRIHSETSRRLTQHGEAEWTLEGKMTRDCVSAIVMTEFTKRAFEGVPSTVACLCVWSRALD